MNIDDIEKELGKFDMTDKDLLIQLIARNIAMQANITTILKTQAMILHELSGKVGSEKQLSDDLFNHSEKLTKILFDSFLAQSLNKD